MNPDQVLAWLPRLLVSRWRRCSARVRRAVWVTVGVHAVLFLTSGPAYAAGATPSALSWIEVKDSHGVSIWQYEMSLDRGGVRHPVRAFWAIIVDLLWQLYRGYIALACWLVDWTLSMDWVGWVATPAMGLGDGLHQVVARLGATTVLLTVTAVVAVLWMARGRWVLGIFELVTSLVIASVAIGVLANPVRLVAGDDGMLMSSRDLGMAIAAGAQNGGSSDASPDHLRHQVTVMLGETFLRRPSQMVNFGDVIDGTRCEKTYDDTLKKGPYGDDDDLRDAVGDCDKAAGEVAENPNSGMVMSLLVLMTGESFVVTFAVVLCGAVLLAGVYALYQSLKMIVALVLALLPGGARGSLWMTFAELIISMVTIIFAVVFLAAYLMLIQAVLAAGSNPMATFFVVDVLLLVGIVVFWKGRKRIRAATETLASAMSTRPGGAGPSALPQKTRINYADAYYKTRLAAQGAKVIGAGVTRTAGMTNAAGRAVGSAAGKAGAAVGKVGGTVRRWGGGQDGPGEGGAVERLRKRVARPHGGRTGQLVRVASQVGLAVATGGASAVAATGARTAAVQTTRQAAITGARRAALDRRLRPALPAGPTGGGGSPGPRRDLPDSPATPTAAGPAGTDQGSAPRVVRGQLARPPSRQPPTGGMSPTRPASSSTTGNAEARLRARLAARRRPIALGPAPSRTPGE
jgi:hypothetical protein